jgi:sugar lactone lactonase YvrE
MGKIVAVAEDGGTADFGVAGVAGAQTTYTLGITTDATGSVYVGVAAGGAPPNTPAPGIWKFPPGGAGSVFSLGTAVTPPMSFANGLDFVGTDLFVADSEGVVYKIDAAGTAAVWSSDHLLAPDKTACGGVVPLPIGANGIVHDANNVYVTNTNFGRLIRIPIAADGSAGTPVVIKEDCATLVGADGLVIDPTDGTFIVALNIQNRLVRVTPTGTVTVLASGAPLASPASVLIDKTGNRRRLLVTNSTFFTAADAGSPGLLALPIP